ncbi:MAG: signal peptidase I [Lachnospiraceae bacterium]|nr:signal peptidase I [Lachnospiraceae bacterium]
MEEKKSLKERNPKLYNVLDWVKIIVVALGVALIINFFVMINSTVPSGSMEPTIMTDSRMLGLRLAYLFSEPKQGDIIIFKYPDDTTQIFVKRIIGVPGDVVEIKGGVTYVNGEALEEPYLKETPVAKDFGPFEVPEKCYFVMGDNRNNSRDSRYWHNKFVPKSDILGKALLVYWPPDEFGGIK